MKVEFLDYASLILCLCNCSLSVICVCVCVVLGWVSLACAGRENPTCSLPATLVPCLEWRRPPGRILSHLWSARRVCGFCVSVWALVLTGWDVWWLTGLTSDNTRVPFLTASDFACAGAFAGIFSFGVALLGAMRALFHLVVLPHQGIFTKQGDL